MQSTKSNTYRFIVQDLSNISLICLIFNWNMVLPTKITSFLAFLEAHNAKAPNTITRPRVILPLISPILFTILPTLNDHWLAGFTSAEGCFSISLLSNSKAFRVRFLISQNSAVNRTVLFHLQTLFNVGAVLPHFAQDHWSYIINGLKNTDAIITYFDNHPLHSKKTESYILWKNLREQLKNKEHLNTETRKEMVKLANRINNLSQPKE